MVHAKRSVGERFVFTLPRVFEWEGRRFAGEGPPLAKARPSREAREGDDGFISRLVSGTKQEVVHAKRSVGERFVFTLS